MADDLQQELVAVGAGHQEVEASLRELAVRKVCCCLGVDDELQRILLLAQLKSLLEGEGEVRAFLVEH